ncbi:MAG: hypothetical protein OEW11_04100 [Nitrospirota bacterium]|nr:hypothetical protein [Nitrospirota bacterium]
MHEHDLGRTPVAMADDPAGDPVAFNEQIAPFVRVAYGPIMLHTGAQSLAWGLGQEDPRQKDGSWLLAALMVAVRAAGDDCEP